jgi:uncharacterized protein (DUF362 family)
MNVTRREFIKGVAAAGAITCAGKWVGVDDVLSDNHKSRIFHVSACPAHDGQLRHQGLDALLDLLAQNGLKFYRTNKAHQWGGPAGIIDAGDVVLLKVNCQWKCRGTTNTDVLRGLIYRILQHPDGFKGEVVIFENGQGRGGFDGITQGGSAYNLWPEVDNEIWVNAEEQQVLTVDYLLYNVFKNDPVSSFLLDPVRSIFIPGSENVTNGYRKISGVSYPCFTSLMGHRIELREGIWTGSEYGDNLKLINLPVLKTHAGTGITGALKHTYGILSMDDGSSGIRHYSESGSQCGKMWGLVKAPDLNILDCIWVSPDSLSGYPVSTTYRANTLVAGIDPVALDYYGSKHLLYPLGGPNQSRHNPDTDPGLITHLSGARDFINANGGIAGEPARMGDENIEVLSASAGGDSAAGRNTGGGGGGGGSACFISAATNVPPCQK